MEEIISDNDAAAANHQHPPPGIGRSTSSTVFGGHGGWSPFFGRVGSGWSPFSTPTNRDSNRQLSSTAAATSPFYYSGHISRAASCSITSTPASYLSTPGGGHHHPSSTPARLLAALLHSASASEWGGGSEAGVGVIGATEDEEDDDEAQLLWAALEKLPTPQLMRASVLDRYGVDGVYRDTAVVDVAKLRPAEQRLYMENLIRNVEEDNRWLLRNRTLAQSEGTKDPNERPSLQQR